MRCPQCNKFAAYNEEEPEIDVSVDEEGNITGTCLIVNTHDECGTELTEAQLDVEGQVDVEGHSGEGHQLGVETSSSERTQRSDGKGRPSRYTKSYYGASATFTVTCSCGKLGDDGKGVDVDWDDDVQASSMEELT